MGLIGIIVGTVSILVGIVSFILAFKYGKTTSPPVATTEAANPYPQHSSDPSNDDEIQV